jgi:UDP-N-acetyl-D-glucosamine dehydrogenase
VKDIFLKKLENKKAKIGIIGMGYVGLPLALSFSEKDFEVTGFDIDSKKISLLSNGESYLKEFPAERINKSVMKGKLLATEISKN